MQLYRHIYQQAYVSYWDFPELTLNRKDNSQKYTWLPRATLPQLPLGPCLLPIPFCITSAIIRLSTLFIPPHISASTLPPCVKWSLSHCSNPQPLFTQNSLLPPTPTERWLKFRWEGKIVAYKLFPVLNSQCNWCSIYQSFSLWANLVWSYTQCETINNNILNIVYINCCLKQL